MRCADLATRTNTLECSHVPPTKKRVLVSGAGVAGIACAVLLDKEKYDVELIEQAGQFRNLGFSIILWKAGFSQLVSLLQKNGESLKDEKDCFKLEGFKMFAGSPLRLVDKVRADGYAWAFKRERLMEILENALRKELPEGHIDFSKGIRHIQYPHESGPAFVTFRDGTQKEYDLVIIAEGAHSSSRELVAVSERIVSDPYALRYAWFLSPTDLGRYGGLLFERGQVAVIPPPHFNNLLGFYFDKGTSEELQTAFEAEVRRCIRRPDGGESVLDTKTSDVFELKEVHLDRYYAKNVVFVGDAAHGRPPTLGFGTSLALEDATLLTHKLNALKEFSEKSLRGVLRAYSDARIPRVEDVYRIQAKVQGFYTKSRLKVAISLLLLRPFLAPYFERNVKRLASFNVLEE